MHESRLDCLIGTKSSAALQSDTTEELLAVLLLLRLHVETTEQVLFFFLFDYSETKTGTDRTNLLGRIYFPCHK